MWEPGSFKDPRAHLLRTIASIERALPASEKELSRRLLAEGLYSRSVELDQLQRLITFNDLPSPFTVLRLQGQNVAVPRGAVAMAKLVHTRTARAVSTWGLASVDAVAFQVETEDTAFIKAMVSTRLDFEWLDEPRGWFWFRDEQTALLSTIKRVLSIAPVVPLRELAQALFRTWPAEFVPPADILGELCRRIPWLEVTGRGPHVKLAEEPSRAHTDDVDGSAMRIFERWGPRIEGAQIFDIARTLGMSVALLRETLRTSTVVVEPEPAVFHFIGASAERQARTPKAQRKRFPLRP